MEESSGTKLTIISSSVTVFKVSTCLLKALCYNIRVTYCTLCIWYANQTSLKLDCIIMHFRRDIDGISEKSFRKILKKFQTLKFCALKIWHYTVIV